MARTDNLGNFLTDVANAIREKKGTNDIIPASNFDEEIKNIVSGGSSEEEIPTDINELPNYINSSFKKYANAVVNNYPVYTEEPITLYTPNADYKYYMIRSRNSVGTEWGIVWFKESSFLVKAANGTIISSKLSLTDFKSSGDSFNISTTYSGLRYNEYSVTGYLVSGFTSFEDCINAIQNPNTVYTTTSSASWGNYDVENYTYLVGATNLPVFYGDNVSTYVVSTKLSRRISSNETIEVIGE